MKFYEEFEKYYADIPDCVCCGVSDYEVVINNVFDLTNGLLVLNKFEGKNENGSTYILNLIINQKKYEFTFNGTEYFEISLLDEFNNIIKTENPNEIRKLIEFSTEQIDFGIAFIEKQKEYELVKAGLIWRDEDWIYLYEQENG